jgi:lysyl-tRNA synthetase class 2
MIRVAPSLVKLFCMTNNDFLPTATIARLKERARVLKRLRAFFDDRGFIEVETPILSHDTVVDRYIEPIGIPRAVVAGRPPEVKDEARPMWLQTSPEFGMKRLLAAGAHSIYQITKSFRAGEMGRMHNPEFTMLEWYRVGDDMNAGMDLLAELVEMTLDIEKRSTDRMSYLQIFQTHVGVDPHVASVEQLQSVCRQHQIEIEGFCGEIGNRDFWLNLLLTHVIEPKLGTSRAIIVYDWPASQSALAIVRDEIPPVAERFELFVDGWELANGYHELLDAEELERRNESSNRARIKDGNHPLPQGSRLLNAMNFGIPGCAGVALGVDRLVMLATGSESIEEVIAFPIGRA